MKFLLHIITFLLTVVFLTLVMLIKKKPIYKENILVLQYNRFFKVLSLFFLLVGIIVIYLSSKGVGIDIEIGWIFTIFLVMPLLLEFFVVKIEVSDKIHTRSPWRLPRVIEWDNIKSLNYSEALQWHVFKTDTQGSLRLHNYISGKDEFIDLYIKQKNNPK